MSKINYKNSKEIKTNSSSQRQSHYSVWKEKSTTEDDILTEAMPEDQPIKHNENEITITNKD